MSNLDKLVEAQKNGEVLGLKGVNGKVARLDIDKLLLEQPDTFNLFALALIELKKAAGTDITSWYQLSGIHGLPRSYWDGVVPQSGGKAAGWGYCAHSSSAFPTWHRPYLALLEQSLYLKMLDIAASFKDDTHKSTYNKAAQKFRLPYWDYFRPRGGKVTFPGIFQGGATSFKYDFSVPKIFTEAQIMLKTPDSPDTLQPVNNPFLSFAFLAASGEIPAADWAIYDKDPDRTLQAFNRNQTQRYPAPKKSDPITNLNWSINKVREDRTYFSIRLMGAKLYNIYDNFAHDSAANRADAAKEEKAGHGGYGSLEGIHGSYHGTVGGTNGHMSRVPVAAFDPIFWFHHCQIDRWFAIWQAVHPDAWFVKDPNETAPLYPFRVSKANTQYWDSNLARDTEDLGYTYPDIVGDAANVLKTFQANYAWSVRQPGASDYGDPPTSMAPLPISDAQVFQYTAGKGLLDLLPNPQQFMLQATAAVMAPAALTKQVVADSAPSNPALVEQPSQASAEVHTLAVSRALTDLVDLDIAVPATEEIDETKFYREWSVDDVVERLALNGAFTLYYFVGPAPVADTDELYSIYPTLAGASHIFAAPEEVCDNCGNQAAQAKLISNTAPISGILKDYVSAGDLADLTAPNVKPFLIKNLKWKIVSADGRVVDPRTVAGLKIGVSSELIPITGGDPIYQEHPDVVTAIIENSA